MKTVRCISLWQPWASLMAVGAKVLETRDWDTKVRGEVYIHAAKTLDGLKLVHMFPMDVVKAMESALGMKEWTWNKGLPFGKIIARGELIATFDGPMALKAYPEQKPFGDFNEGRFAHLYDKLTKIDPILCSGKQGFFYAEIPEPMTPGEANFGDQLGG